MFSGVPLAIGLCSIPEWMRSEVRYCWVTLKVDVFSHQKYVIDKKS